MIAQASIPLRNSPKAIEAPSPVGSRLLQRKCACGGNPGASGECDECRRKRQVGGMPGIQTKLSVNKPGDLWEQEADRIADRVVSGGEHIPARSPALIQVQRAGSGFGSDSAGVTASPQVSNVLDRPGQPLDAGARAFMEGRFGHDFGKVRVHTDVRAADSARAVNALAYTVGEHIVFGAGQYTPQTGPGRRLLAHELTHVLQQQTHSGRSALMRQACGHDGQDVNCGGGALARWRLVDIATQAVTNVALDDLVVNQGLRRHFSGNWVTQVQTPPNPVKEGMERGRVDGAKVTVGSSLRVEVVEVKSRSTAFHGGCGLATREANGYVTVLRAIAPQILAVSRAAASMGGLRTPGNRLNAAQRTAMRAAGVDLDDLLDAQAWAFYNGLQNRMNTTFTTAFTSLDVDVNRDGSPRQDYLVEPPVMMACRTRRRRPGVKTRQLLFQVNQVGGVSYGCRDTGCVEEDEDEQRRELERGVQPEESRQTQRLTEEEEERPTDRPTDQPETDVTIPIMVGAGGTAALSVAAIAAARRRAARIAAERAAAELLRRQAAQRALQEALRRDALRRAEIAAAERAAASTAARSTARAAATRTALRAAAYLEIGAGVLLIASGRAEARVGPGESPLETLYRSMTSNGAPPSPEMRALIESDPALRQLAGQAVASGDVTPLQAELSRRTLELIRDNPGEFSQEDLALLAELSGAISSASGTTPPQTVEEMHAAIEQARALRASGATPQATEGQGSGTGGTGSTGTAGRQGTGPEADASASQQVAQQFPSLSAEARQQLAQAPDQVRRLLTAMTSQGGRGPQVNDEAVRRFLQTAPADLTEAEVNQLIQRIQPATTESLDDILGRMQSAVRGLRAAREPQGDAQGDADQAQPDPGAADSEEEGVTREEYVRAIVAHIAGFDGWSRMAVDELRIVVASTDQSLRGAIINQDVLTLVFYGRVPVQGGVVRIAATARAVVAARTATSVTVRLTTAAVFIDEAGRHISTLPAGHQFANMIFVH